MNCFDCLTLDHVPRPAVGVCHDCGAGVCGQHTVVRVFPLVRMGLIQRVEPVQPPARVLRCTTCDAAYTAAQGGSSRRHRSGTTKPAGTPAITL